ncbi:hypothetical protein JCM10908_005604 [Rhodotorula pacifica]|uniref:Zn(II)2Cys6 transcription factor n=1 Tax=Rhodotorula pacifica TaxID=1495444 RepID=UPI00317ABA4D
MTGSSRGPTGLRPFRSKKVRPCDGCRRRKNRCALPVEGEPCVECKQTGRPCTYDLPPPQRPKRESTTTTKGPTEDDFAPGPSTATFPASRSTTSPAVPERTGARSTSPIGGRNAKRQRTPAVETLVNRRDHSVSTASAASLDSDVPAGMEMSAVTATLTDDLLTFRSAAPPRQISKDQNRAQFVLFRTIPASRPAVQDAQMRLLRSVRSYIDATAPALTDATLYSQYLSYLHPSMPVLPLDPPPPFDTLPPALRAVILAESLSYLSPAQSSYAWELIKSSQISDRTLYTARLSSLALAILDLSHPVDPRGDYILLAKTIAQAQVLGLHLDCQAWAIPESEKSLRTRLWWCLRIYDAGASFLNSHPSHIQANNHNVQLPALPTDVSPVGPAIRDVAFVLQCRLIVIVAKLQAEVSTLDNYGSQSRVTSCDAIERELEALCGSVASFTSSQVRPDGMDCFLFNLFAFRCMVRRISIEIRIGLGNSFAPDGNTVQIFGDLVNFCRSCTSHSFGPEQPWYAFTSHILSSVLSSLIRVSLAALGSRQSEIAYPDNAAPQGRARPPSPVQLLGDLAQFCGNARRAYGWRHADAAIERAHSVIERMSAISQATASPGLFDSVILALKMVDEQPSPNHSNTVETASDLAALDLLASLIPNEGATGAVGETNGTDHRISWPTASADPAAAIAPAPAAETTPLFGSDALDLPDLEDWLNVLDGREHWGAEQAGAGVWPETW